MSFASTVRAPLCAIGLLLPSAIAGADEFKPAPNAAFMVDLDTMDGHFSVWRQQDLAGLNAMRVHVVFNRRGAGKFAPLAMIGVAAGKTSALLQFAAFGDGLLDGGVSRSDAKDRDAESVALPPRFREPFDVEVRWTPEGKVTFLIFTASGQRLAPQGEHHSIDLGAPITAVELGASTAEIEFGKVELGAIEPAAAPAPAAPATPTP